MLEFDLIVLGTGPAASRVAAKCAAANWKVAIVESREFGGTCALRGCNPKKVLVGAAELVDWARRAEGKLATCPDIRINWQELVAFKREFTQPVKETSEAKFQKKGIETYSGLGEFRDNNTVAVGEQLLQAKHVLVAVGAKPAPLGIPGSEHAVLSDQFMELEQLPRRIVFIGGGYISFEFAHVAARAGSEVVILDRGVPLKQFDPDLVRSLCVHSQQAGVRVVPNATINRIEQCDNKQGYSVFANVAGKESTYSADLIVHGAGRVPNLDGLKLDSANIECSDDGIVVNKFFQSPTNESVFAAGDCAATGKPMLTTAANQQARTIGLNLLAGRMEHEADYGAIPSAVFSVPALASVGMSEDESLKQGFDVEIRQGDMSDWGSVRKVCATCAEYKILIDKSNDKILGAHLLGPHAAESINVFAMAIKAKMTATDVKSVLFTFPTFTSDIRSML